MKLLGVVTLFSAVALARAAYWALEERHWVSGWGLCLLSWVALAGAAVCLTL